MQISVSTLIVYSHANNKLHLNMRLFSNTISSSTVPQKPRPREKGQGFYLLDEFEIEQTLRA